MIPTYWNSVRLSKLNELFFLNSRLISFGNCKVFLWKSTWTYLKYSLLWLVLLETHDPMCYIGTWIHLMQANFLCFDVPIKSIAYFRWIAQTALIVSDFPNVYCWLHLFRRSQLIRLWRGRQPFPWRPAIDSTAFIQLTRAARGVSKEAARRVVSPIGPTERPTGRNSIDVGNRSARKPRQLHTRHPRRAARIHKKGRQASCRAEKLGIRRASACLIIISSDRRRKGYTHTLTQSFSQPRVCFNAKSLRQIKMIIKGVEC
jgi:hypothetical protein